MQRQSKISILYSSILIEIYIFKNDSSCDTLKTDNRAVNHSCIAFRREWGKPSCKLSHTCPFLQPSPLYPLSSWLQCFLVVSVLSTLPSTIHSPHGREDNLLNTQNHERPLSPNSPFQANSNLFSFTHISFMFLIFSSQDHCFSPLIFLLIIHIYPQRSALGYGLHSNHVLFSFKESEFCNYIFFLWGCLINALFLHHAIHSMREETVSGLFFNHVSVV